MFGIGYLRYWHEVGVSVARGMPMKIGDFSAIYDNLDLGSFKPEFLPNSRLVTGSAKDRKAAIFYLAAKLWGVSPGRWLEKENAWLKEARKESGSTLIAGKDSLDDVISPELLLHLVAAAAIIKKDNDSNKEITWDAAMAANLSLSEACVKGRTRMTMVKNQSIYGILKANGLMIGSGGIKYLPFPEVSLPELLQMLNRDSILPEVYIK